MRIGTITETYSYAPFNCIHECHFATIDPHDGGEPFQIRVMDVPVKPFDVVQYTHRTIQGRAVFCRQVYIERVIGRYCDVGEMGLDVHALNHSLTSSSL